MLSCLLVLLGCLLMQGSCAGLVSVHNDKHTDTCMLRRGCVREQHVAHTHTHIHTHTHTTQHNTNTNARARTHARTYTITRTHAHTRTHARTHTRYSHMFRSALSVFPLIHYMKRLHELTARTCVCVCVRERECVCVTERERECNQIQILFGTELTPVKCVGLMSAHAAYG